MLKYYMPLDGLRYQYLINNNKTFVFVIMDIHRQNKLKIMQNLAFKIIPRIRLVRVVPFRFKSDIEAGLFVTVKLFQIIRLNAI